MPLVKIKPGLSHAHYSAGEVFDATPAEMESFGDKFEPAGEDLEQDVRKILAAAREDESVSNNTDTAIEADATLGARRLAQEHGVNLALSGIVGSGKDGKITKADVQAVLNGDA